MRIVGLVYVDHQDAVRYPVALVAASLSWCAYTYILVSDEGNAVAVSAALGAAGRCSVHVLGAYVTCPADIARAWNASIIWARERDDWDFLVVSPADTLATDQSAEFCTEFASKEGSLERAAQFPIQESKLFHDFGNGWGQTMIGRDWAGSFSELCDGSKLDGANLDMSWWTYQSTLHIGYLSIDAAYRHQKHEAKPELWGNAYPWLAASCSVYEADGADAFVRYMLPLLRAVHNQPALVPVDIKDARFGPIIDALGLRSERDRVVAIAQTLR